ncbi:MAG: hypothetical protein ACE5E3_06480 [Mariprofundus sp.]
MLICILALASAACSRQAPEPSPQELATIGQLIYHNECASQESCLTSWNAGEEFASLGIGHFIWYPAEVPQPFDESFPKLLHFMHEEGVVMPPWLAADLEAPCPWPGRNAFLSAFNSQKMVEIRSFLAETKQKQVEFIAKRLKGALPKMLTSIPEARRDHVRKQFYRVAHAPMGMYALIDYVNFKGEGTKITERYQGQGWGLLQVLQAMQGSGSNTSALTEFSQSAIKVLTQRVKLSPPERDEQRWLAGWKKRVRTYVPGHRPLLPGAH